MDAAKTARAEELLAIDNRSWTNAQFWEADRIISTTPTKNDVIVDLLFAWCDAEEYRIDTCTHSSRGEALNAELNRMWPID